MSEDGVKKLSGRIVGKPEVIVAPRPQELCSYSVAAAPGTLQNVAGFYSPDVCLAAAEEYIPDVVKR